ncbi:hypothetical protein [Billgrantia desiderata]|nr:hypothetical protein [Halomonas desiderata]
MIIKLRGFELEMGLHLFYLKVPKVFDMAWGRSTGLVVSRL